VLTWPTVILLGVGSYTLRLLGLAVISRDDLPPWAVQPLQLLPPAILAALIATLLVAPGQAALNPRLAGVFVAAILIWRRGSLAVAMVLAATVTALLRLVLP
jgi:branched-subunit amino acid transport protein